MKKQLQLLSLCFCMAISTTIFAQLPDGSQAPDFSVSDLNGGSHSLYSDYLDAGKTVYIDFSATWCGPCWNYHNTHALRDLHDEYGPSGTNELMVFFIEPDASTEIACLYGPAGCTGGTQGDWVTGTTYPIVDEPSLNSTYAINYYPTIYGICPSGSIYEVGQAGTNQLYDFIEQECALRVVVEETRDEQCFEGYDGIIELQVSGGTGDYEFEWSHGASDEDLDDLTKGVYSCTVTSGGETEIVDDIFIDGPDFELRITEVIIEDAPCNGETGGSISIEEAGGGTEPYTYEWSHGGTGQYQFGLPAGEYTCNMIDANNCIFSGTYSIEEPSALESDATSQPEFCGQSNGVIEVTTDGGTGPYSYDIGDGAQLDGLFEDVEAGDYVVVVLDAMNCQTDVEVTVSEIPGPVADAGNAGQITCTNQTVILNGNNSSQGNTIDVEWSTNNGNIVSGADTYTPTVDAAGVYTITIHDTSTGCITEDFITVVANDDIPSADAGTGGQLDCNTTSIMLNGSNSDLGNDISFEWTTVDGNIVSGENTLMPTVNAPGTYVLTLTNMTTNCKGVSSVVVTVDPNTPLALVQGDYDLSCSADAIMIDGSGSQVGPNAVIVWTTTDGNIVSGENTLTPMVDAAGTYVLTITDPNTNCVSTETVVVGTDIRIPSANSGQGGVLTCLSDLVTLNGEASEQGAHIVILWSTVDGNIVSDPTLYSVIVNEPGTYVLTVLDTESGCENTSEVTVTEFINDPISNYDYTVGGNTVQFTDASSGDPMSYLWEASDGQTSTEQNPSFTFTEEGIYNVCLTITNECGMNTTCSDVVISRTTEAPFPDGSNIGQEGWDETNLPPGGDIQIGDINTLTRIDAPTFRFAPNPFGNAGVFMEIYIPSNESSTVEIFDITGKSVYQNQFDSGYAGEQIDISKLNSGTFIAVLNFGDQTITRKIVKQ